MWMQVVNMDGRIVDIYIYISDSESWWHMWKKMLSTFASHMCSTLQSFCCGLVGSWIDFWRTVYCWSLIGIVHSASIHLQSKGSKTSVKAVSSQPCDATIACHLHSCDRLWWCTARIGVTSTIGRASAWWSFPLHPVVNSTGLLWTLSPEDEYVNSIWHMNSMEQLCWNCFLAALRK